MTPCQGCIHATSGHIRWSGHYRSCMHPSVRHGEEGLAMLGVEIGTDNKALIIEEGWFSFPYNYDPTWISSCKAQEVRP